jgi:hypothetical protein
MLVIGQSKKRRGNKMHKTITQRKPYKDVSDRYKFINTQTVLNKLEKYNWDIVNVQEARVIDKKKQGYQKHMVRLQNTALNTTALRPEVVLYNSHDRSGTFSIHIGMFRMACMNGLVMGDYIVPAFKFKHIGQVKIQLKNMMDFVSDGISDSLKNLNLLNSISLTKNEQGIYVAKGLEMRHGAELDNIVIDTEQLIKPRRVEDKAPTVFNTLNKTQEALTKGGYRIWKKDEDGNTSYGNSRRAKKLTNVKATLDINRSLSDLANKMAVLKS